MLARPLTLTYLEADMEMSFLSAWITIPCSDTYHLPTSRRRKAPGETEAGRIVFIYKDLPERDR
jgi:hypothetical protein